MLLPPYMHLDPLFLLIMCQPAKREYILLPGLKKRWAEKLNLHNKIKYLFEIFY